MIPPEMITFTEDDKGQKVAIHVINVNYVIECDDDVGFIIVGIGGKELKVKGKLDGFFPVFNPEQPPH